MPRLKLLGRAAILDDEGGVDPISARKHPVALLALLAAAPGHALGRSKLVGLLWPEVTEKVGRNRMTTCVHQVRSALGEEVLTSVGGDLQLNLEALPADVADFESRLDAGDPGGAVERYDGPFLDGFWLSGCEEFEEWAERARARLEHAYRDALETLAQGTEGGDPKAAVRWWRERAARSPLDTRVALGLIGALVRMGSRGEASKAAETHRRALREELGTRPGEEFEEAVERLLRGASGVTNEVIDPSPKPGRATSSSPTAVASGRGAHPESGGGASRPGLRWVGLTALTILAGAAGWGLRPVAPPSSAPVARFTIDVPGGLEMYMAPDFGVAPDGRTVVYIMADTLFARRLDEKAATPLTTLSDECCPEFTRDGRWVYFDRHFDPSPIGVSVDDGTVVDLTSRFATDPYATGTWSGEGIRVIRAGQVSEQVTTVDVEAGEGAHLWPQLLPGGRYLVYTRFGPSIMWSQASVVVKDLSTGEERVVAEGATYGRYVETGHVVYVDEEGTLLGVPFDLASLEVTGQPLVFERGIKVAHWGGGASFSVSDNGTLAFTRGSSLGDHSLTWLDRRGRVVEEVGLPFTGEGTRLSPDGRRVTTYVASATSDVGVFDLSTGERRRFTFGPETEDNPVWSPDGERIAYHQVVSGSEHRLYEAPLSGEGEPRLLATLEYYVAPRSYSPQGRWLAYWADGRLEVVDTREGAVDTLLATVQSEGGVFSPDGRWLAYVTEESGQPEVYVASWPGMGARRQISRDGGRYPEWSKGSGELFFAKGDTLMVTDVTTGGSFDHTSPRPLFVSEVFGSRSFWFSVSADGERILIAASRPEARPGEIEVVVNWFEEVKGR